MRLKTMGFVAAFIGALLTFGKPASAEGIFGDTKIFAGLKGGLVVVPDLDYNSGVSTIGQTLNGFLSTDMGKTIGAEVTALHSSGFFGGIEVNYFHAYTGQILINAQTFVIGSGPLNGDLSGFSAFANFGYQFDFGDDVKPYIVAGIGAAHVTVDRVTTPLLNGFLDDSDLTLVGKIGGGVAIPITEDIDIIAEYTYVRGLDLEFQFTAPTQSTPFEVEFAQHLARLGARMGF